jgi:hypothetical protein
MLRIDAALTPPGFIAHAKMHTLVYRDGTLHVLYTGPGPRSRADWGKALGGGRLHRGMLENLAIGALMRKYMKTILPAEERITESNLEDLSREKNCFRLSKKEISDIDVKVTPVDIRLTFQGAGKKFKFDCGLEDKLALDELVALITG